MTTWTIHSAATEFGVSRETISRGLRANGVETEPSKTYSTKQIFTAIAGDFKRERTLRERAERIKVERENQIADGELHHFPTIHKALWETLLAPLRVELLNLPAQVAGLCNPQEPDVAKKVLENHLAGILQKIHAGQSADPAPEN